MAKTTSGACHTRRTKADISTIRDAIIEVIEDDPPMTGRQVFYQLVAQGGDRKNRNGIPALDAERELLRMWRPEAAE